MEEKGIRLTVDDRAEKIGYKIREARNMRIRYMLIVGEKEVEDRLVSVRKIGDGDQGQVKLEEFIEQLIGEIEEKK